ncbi:glutamine amidotransferase-related protein [Rhizobium sp. LEGMi135b]
MNIGILATGEPPSDLTNRYGGFDDMFIALLGPGFNTQTFRVYADELPKDPTIFDGFIVTGSPAGVHDGSAWIETLSKFLKDVRGKTKLVGVCFGHQLMAEAFGGKTDRAERGWGLGLHQYRVDNEFSWMGDGKQADIAIAVTHQDQVIAVPVGTKIVASSDFTPYAALAYDESSISFQCHPEFEPEFACSLLRVRHSDRLSSSELQTIADTYQRANDNKRVGEWIRRFFKG